MDHHEVDQSWSTDRLSRQILVRAYCVCVSIAAPLPGGTRLAALRTHDQKNGLQSSDRRGICKNHGKSGSGRTWDWSEAILEGSGPVSCDGQGKAHRKWANGCAGKLFRNDFRIIQVISVTMVVFCLHIKKRKLRMKKYLQ